MSFREVTREEFRDVYCRLGGGGATGWGEASWRPFERDGMRYLVELPESPLHTRMMITSDFGRKEFRLFFLTEESEERFFSFPESRPPSPPSPPHSG